MKHNKRLLVLLFMIVSAIGFSQENESEKDTVSIANEKKLDLNVDIVSRYLWRGQCWGGDYVAVQPTIEYAVTPKFSLGFWATTNFKGDYFYPDGETAYKGYQEIDFYATYQLNDFLQFQLWDYYWPSVSKVEGVDNGFFNYGKDGTKTVDAMLYFDFSEGYKFPFNATISTLVAGNDYRYDADGENPKQNFTTYLELGYTFTLFEKSASKVLNSIELAPVIGAVLNNKAEYYSYADYDEASFVNMGLKATKEFDLGNGITMPLSLNYIHNGAKNNTETFGKNFLVAGISFSY
ncbi:TorF family putative porin [Flavobacterium phycosphaerae]|uniref:TorF family putative porin n=1 Tax=Flavobacterium phycosphaerae TaxID=2697515 RepID=UPI001389F60C|nr:TorF family putative porin [Flavobacterium phycosphaerae]